MKTKVLASLTGRRNARRPESGSEADEALRRLVMSMDVAERVAVTELMRDELLRGWIPKRADLEAALALVRGNGA